MTTTNGSLVQLLAKVKRPREFAAVEVADSIRRTALRLLRHECSEGKLNHDSFGLIPLKQLQEVICSQFEQYEIGNLEETIRLQLEQLAIREQIEFRGDRIRALYGHSLRNIIVGMVDCPPPLLWHATARRYRQTILLWGLRKRHRSSIHLTSSFSYASDIALSGSLNQDPILLAVDAEKCLDADATFRRPNSHVWLTNRVPPAAIRVVTEEPGWWYKPLQTD